MAPVWPTPGELAMFAHLTCRPEADLDLAMAALAIAEPEYPGLDFDVYLRQLDALAEDVAPQVRGVRETASQAVNLVTYLVHAAGFRGNTGEYDDPRNSFLNEVLERRLGIPITLSVMMIEVARRLSVPLSGVSFPGHFLLRAGRPEEPPLFLDPFSAHALSPEDLRELLFRHTGERRDPRPAELDAVSKQTILVRMLNNLRNIYAQRGDYPRMRLAAERQKTLAQAGAAKAGPGAAGARGVWH